MNLKPKFAKVDKLRAQLNAAERDLKSAVSEFARKEGLLATPRPETLRAQLGL